MLELMTWSEIVDNFRQEGSLKMAAIFDLGGEKLAASESVDISQHEARGLVKSLQTPFSSMFALFVGGSKVICMQVDDRTLIGKTMNAEVFVAHLAKDVLICAYTAAGSNTSCLGSIKDFIVKLNMQSVPDAVASPSLI